MRMSLRQCTTETPQKQTLAKTEEPLTGSSCTWERNFPGSCTAAFRERSEPEFEDRTP